MNQGPQRKPAEPESRDGLVHVVFVILGAIVGGVLIGGRLVDAGITLGAGFGLVTAQLRLAHARATRREQQVAALQARVEHLERVLSGSARPDDSPEAVRTDTEETATGAAAESGAETPRPAPQPTPDAPTASAPAPTEGAPPSPVPPPASTFRPPPPRRPGFAQRMLQQLRELLFGGNTVVRVGILVLLVGVTLLARWAAEHSLFPIEARLAVASLIGLALVGVGYRLRTLRPGFGATLQGGGLAALYLVSFISFRFYELVPVGMAFGLFVVIAAASGTLAVLQRSLPLIVIASLGGFLAPILASTGSGNHVGLFSYYLVLNASIAAIAFARSWRVLNLLAFVCTYGVATVWGVLSYEPAHRASTLPFVFAFLLLFTGEALLFAWRQPPRLRGLVDGTLVFGTPLVSLLALARLLQDVEMGLALATSAMAVFYGVVALWLWRTAPATLRQLSEAFVALAVGLATMAVPFAFEDSPTTAIVWALEGAGIHWMGARQSRAFPRWVGLGLQPLAALAFAIWLFDSGAVAPRTLANGRFLSALALTFAGLAIAREADRRRAAGLVRGDVLWHVAQVAGVWGLLWWSFGVLGEIAQFAPDRFFVPGLVAATGATAVCLQLSASALRWESGQAMSLLSLPTAALLLPIAASETPGVLAHGGVVAWPLALVAIHWVIGCNESSTWRGLRLAYAPWLWLCALVSAFALHGLADGTHALGADWEIAGLGFGLGATATAFLHAIHADRGAFGRFPRLHFTWGVGPILALGLVWVVASHFAAEGVVRPLPYLPLLNPVDATVALVAVATLVWLHRFRAIESPELLDAHRPKLWIAAAVLAFAWLNAMIARTVAAWTDVPHRADALWDSTPLQVALSIAWTLVGFAGMWASNRRGLRRAWMAFAGLLGITVLKLFVVDLSQLTTPAKIGTFLAVGVLLLVVGYFSPVPPEVGADAELPDDEPDAPPSGDGRASTSAAGIGTALLVWLAVLATAGPAHVTPAHADEPPPLEMSDFAWQRAVVSGGADALQVVDLPFEIYRDSAEPGLADLRVFDAARHEVPHAIAKTPAAPIREPALTPLPLIPLPDGPNGGAGLAPIDGYRVDVGLAGNAATLKLEPSLGDGGTRSEPRAILVDASRVDGPIVGLEFELAPSGEDALVPLRVEATDDFVAYRVLSPRAVVARLAGGSADPIEQKRVAFAPTEARYLRIVWPPEGEAPALVGVSAIQRAPSQPVRRESVDIPTQRIEDDAFVADLGGWVPVDRLQIDLGQTRALVSARVYRADAREGPWRLVHRGLIYQLDPAGPTDSSDAETDDDGRSPPIAFGGAPTRFIKLEIDAKGGGAGRPAPTLEVSWPTEQLVFLDQGGAPHTVVYGRRGAPADRYDARELLRIEGRRRDPSTPLPVTAKLGPRVELGGAAAFDPVAPLPVRTIALWGVLLASVAFVAMLALRLLREMRD